MTAFVFVPLLALAAVVVYAVAVFAAHHYITIVECTAHGSDEVRWPGEAFYEWLWKPLYLGWLAAAWAAPAGLLGLMVGKVGGPAVGVLAGVAALAFLFPVGQLSAFVAGHPWMPFHPKAPWLMLVKPGVTAGFYGIAAGTVLVAAAGALLVTNKVVVTYGGPVLGSVVLAVAWFVYARVVGRLLFVLTYAKDSAIPPSADVKLPVCGADSPVPARKGKNTRPAEPKPARSAGPEVLPPLNRPKRPWDDEDDTPYAVHAPEVVIERIVDERVIRPKESELRLLARNEVPPPTRPWGPEVWGFLGQAETARSVLVLALLLTVLSVVVRALIDLSPSG